MFLSSILFMWFGLFALKRFYIVWFSNVECSWWTLFQKRVVFIKFDIYMSICTNVSVVSMSAIASAISLLLTFVEEEGQES